MGKIISFDSYYQVDAVTLLAQTALTHHNEYGVGINLIDITLIMFMAKAYHAFSIRKYDNNAAKYLFLLGITTRHNVACEICVVDQCSVGIHRGLVVPIPGSQA